MFLISKKTQHKNNIISIPVIEELLKLTGNNNNNNNNNSNSNSNSQEIIELLIEHNPTLMTLLTSQITCLHYLFQQHPLSTTTTISSSLYSATIHFTTLSIMILIGLFESKATELSILLPGEGELAFETIFQTSPRVY